jgi:hypothetical protein
MTTQTYSRARHSVSLLLPIIKQYIDRQGRPV